jgi:hypothetical protein
MKFDNAARVEEVVWDMRIADLPRAEDRATVNRLYNGDPPWTDEEARENHVDINRNDLTGVTAMTQARTQWNNAFLKPGNYFSVALDSGDRRKRAEWGHTITRAINRRLKRRQPMMEQLRSKGGQALLHGLGPVNWTSRQTPIPRNVANPSFLFPSETDVGGENMEYYAVFHESTASELYELTHGPKLDPGWKMGLVNSELKRVMSAVRKETNATAFQYMPERIEELIKQDKGYYGSDAVPTVDWWDFYFREAEDGDGWYRRVILDWGTDYKPRSKSDTLPTSRNRLNEGGKEETHFLYSSGERRYADSLNEILQVQVLDCSAVFPAKLHSARGLGWMLWGICDLENRLNCRFNEAVFLQLMWIFRVASDEQLKRLRVAEFSHLGVIPNGIDFVKGGERHIPDLGLVNLAFQRNRQMIADNAAPFSKDLERTQNKEMTATETMARLNAVNTLVSGMLTLAYSYEEYCYREICRRFCLKNSRDMDVKAFRRECLIEGVPPELLDSDRWDVTAERVLGGGNKTLEMAEVQFLQSIRKNLNPDAQRQVDHLSIDALDQPGLADKLAPVAGKPKVTQSAADAQFATDRILRGLPFALPADAIVEDYILVWIQDLKALIQQMGNPMIGPNPERLAGAFALAQALQPLIKQLGQNQDERHTALQYEKARRQLEMVLKRLAMAWKKRQGQQQQQPGGGEAQAQVQSKVAIEQAKTQAALQGRLLLDKVDAQNKSETHAARTAQKQIAFELDQRRKDRAANADMRRRHVQHGQDMALQGLRSLSE